MQPSTDAIAYEYASIDIAAPAATIYSLITTIERMGEWSPEATGGRWLDDGSADVGCRFEGHNKSGDREWSRMCEVVVADPGRDFTFVVGGVESNFTWWSYEMAPTETGTRLTERWWIVNKSPAMAAATDEQFAARVDLTKTMLVDTLAALKAAAER